MLKRLMAPQTSLSTRDGLLLGAASALLAGLADFLTGPYMWWAFVYVLPTALFSWLSPVRVAWLLALFAGAVTTTANLLWEVPGRHALVPFWNGAATSATCLAVSLALSKLRDLLHENELVMRVVSHDLLNVLTALRMNAEYLLSQTDRGDARFPTTESMALATARMRRIVSDLSIAAHGDGKALQIALAPVDLARLVADAVGFLQAAAAARNVRLALHVQPGAEYAMYADAERIAEALDNVLGNALKFTPAGGAIDVSLEGRAHEIEIHVRDTGPGIAAHERPAVFKAYWKGRAANGGAGLGLHISKVIVEKHGGEIWIDGGDSGADFGIRLPRNEDRAAAPPK